MPASDPEEGLPSATKERHKPSALLAGTVTLMDDLIAPAIPESDWEALK